MLEETGGLQSMGYKDSDTTEWLKLFIFILCQYLDFTYK